MSKKKIPQRMCIGCQKMLPKKELIRVVKTPEGDILIDLTGKKSGRGAYICANNLCFKEAEKSKKLEKAFKTNISQDVYKKLAGYFQDHEN